jgi:YaaC-like Protein
MIGDVAWRGLRALRADLLQLAGKGERRKVFSAALEQAEQLFRRAASLGYASRPLNLFYGLSQAGRALSAAHDPQQSTWRLHAAGLGVELSTGSGCFPSGCPGAGFGVDGH